MARQEPSGTAHLYGQDVASGAVGDPPNHTKATAPQKIIRLFRLYECVRLIDGVDLGGGGRRA